MKLQGFSRFVTTKASAYCFLPSITALKWIAAMPQEQGADETLDHVDVSWVELSTSSTKRRSPM